MSEDDRDPLYFPAVVLVCALLFASLMLGCAEAPKRIAGTGERVAPPSGWIDYCYRHREDPGCKPLYDELGRK